jgi:hypothetical protein
MIAIMRHRYKSITVVFAILVGIFPVVACGNNDGDSDNDDPDTSINLTLDMELPDSITGGRMPSTSSVAIQPAAQSDSDLPCVFMGSEEDDFFENGYEMTKFMVSAIATWTCIADTLIDIAATVDHDGEVHQTDNVIGEDDYDEEDPTHYSVSDDSDTQTTVRFWYGYNQAEPPEPDDDPQFFLSWNAPEDGDLTGRLIIDGEEVNPEDRDPDDPTMVRMDFTYSDTQEQADMYLQFDENNEWAEGFRIQVGKDLTASPLGQKFTALGLIKMKAQFFELDGITEVPDVHMFTVADALGNGAALAEFRDISVPLIVNEALNNHLGNYLFDKDDIYFFEDDGDWEWIYKSIADAVYRGSRNEGTGGSPEDPDLETIATWLELDADYFTGNKCAVVNDDCTDLLNAVFEDGFAEQEPNQGSDPGDWRSTAIGNPTYLLSIYPNGADWTGAFDFSYTP